MKRQGDLAALSVLLATVLLWYGGLAWWSHAEPAFNAEERTAARTMFEAIHVISEEATRRGFPPDRATDPNATGLIGLPFSEITTTLGSLPAKRTGAQPEAAALMVRLLRQAGVRRGDRVTVDSSGSFPGFAIATLVAAQSLGAGTVSTVSIGASTYGANRPEFTLGDMIDALVDHGILPHPPAAVSPGGASDLGRDIDPAALEAALARLAKRGAAIIQEPDLAADVNAKRAVLDAGQRPRVLVSLGGNWASAGPGEGLLGRTGLLNSRDFGPTGPSGTGLIQSYLRSGTPVIRILDVQDLCARTGLSFDPIPWPPEGQSNLYQRTAPPRAVIALGPLLALAGAFLVRWRRSVKARWESLRDAGKAP
jgi:poly-gamma-glutamate system protein